MILAILRRLFLSYIALGFINMLVMLVSYNPDTQTEEFLLRFIILLLSLIGLAITEIGLALIKRKENE